MGIDPQVDWEHVPLPFEAEGTPRAALYFFEEEGEKSKFLPPDVRF